jgi:predicted dehydrogenase
MKLALLGIDAEVLALAEAAMNGRRHHVVAVYDAGQPTDELRQLAPLARWNDQWESLLLGTVADAVIVASRPSDELRADQLRNLVKAGVPLVLVHPACEAIVGYELEMIRHDTNCVVVPYFSGRLHPALVKLAELVGSSPFVGNKPAVIGAVEQLVFERSMPQRGRAEVLAQLARDVALIRAVVGEVDKISAMGAAAEQPSLTNLSVHMSGPSGVLARWSVGPVDEQPVGRLVLIGAHGRATLTMPADEQAWSLEIAGQNRETISFDNWNGPDTALDLLEQSLEGHQPAWSWPSACRDAEIASAVEQSLRRGRTIQLYEEQHTEQQTFKGIMAVGGCGLLLLACTVLLAVAMVEGLQLPFRQHILWRLWPLYLTAPFAIFLLLQFFQLVFPASSAAPAKKSSDSDKTVSAK